MKNILITLLITGLIFTFVSCGKARTETENDDNLEANTAQTTEADMNKEEKREYVAGEILVKFKPEVNAEDIPKIAEEEYNCEIIDIIKGIDVYRLKIPADKNVPEMIELFSSDSRVKYAEPNRIYRIQK